MGGHSVEDVKKQVKVYMIVFVSLLALTVVTVAVSYLHLSTHLTIILALIVASIKGSLVGLYFMHLIDEKRAIYASLLLTAFMFLVCMLVPVFTEIENFGG